MTTATNPDRVRFDQPALRNDQEINDALYRIGVRKNRIALVKARCKMLVDAIKRLAQSKIDILSNENASAGVQIDQFLRHHEGDFQSPNPRSRVLTFGKIGWRKLPKKIDLDESEEQSIIADIKALGDKTITAKTGIGPLVEYLPAAAAVKVTITSTLANLGSIVEQLETSGQGDTIEMRIIKGAFKALPEESLKALGIELSGDDVPFYEPDSKSVTEHAGALTQPQPIETPTTDTIAASLKAFSEE